MVEPGVELIDTHTFVEAVRINILRPAGTGTNGHGVITERTVVHSVRAS